VRRLSACAMLAGVRMGWGTRGLDGLPMRGAGLGARFLGCERSPFLVRGTVWSRVRLVWCHPPGAVEPVCLAWVSSPKKQDHPGGSLTPRGSACHHPRAPLLVRGGTAPHPIAVPRRHVPGLSRTSCHLILGGSPPASRGNRGTSPGVRTIRFGDRSSPSGLPLTAHNSCGTSSHD